MSESDNSPASSGDRFIQHTFSERSLYVLTYNQKKQVQKTILRITNKTGHLIGAALSVATLKQ